MVSLTEEKVRAFEIEEQLTEQAKEVEFQM
jgi:hypothetical protein